jgi:hypothetical protein
MRISKIVDFYNQYENGNCFQSFFGKEKLTVCYMDEQPADLESYVGCVVVVETDPDGPRRVHRKRGTGWDSPRRFSLLKSVQEPIYVSYRTRSDKRFSYSRYYKEINGRRVYLTFVKQRSEEEAAAKREKSQKSKRKRKRKTETLPVPVHPTSDDLLPSIKRFRNLLMVAPHDFCYQRPVRLSCS